MMTGICATHKPEFGYRGGKTSSFFSNSCILFSLLHLIFHMWNLSIFSLNILHVSPLKHLNQNHHQHMVLNTMCLLKKKVFSVHLHGNNGSTITITRTQTYTFIQKNLSKKVSNSQHPTHEPYQMEKLSF